MKTRILLAALMICNAAGCNSEKNVEALQGRWRLSEMHGSFRFYLGSAKAGSAVMTFTDDRFTYEFGEDMEGRKRTARGTFACDTTKTPKQITFVFGDHTVVGIYRVYSVSLQICVGESDDVAPTKFDGGPGRRPAMLFFELVQ
jgi:uncharacterized protein (TIGR03067 family)